MSLETILSGVQIFIFLLMLWTLSRDGKKDSRADGKIVGEIVTKLAGHDEQLDKLWGRVDGIGSKNGGLITLAQCGEKRTDCRDVIHTRLDAIEETVKKIPDIAVAVAEITGALKVLTKNAK